MQYTSEQAHFLAAFMLGDYTRERELTRRVLAAAPAGKEDYQPSEKCMTALNLVWHIASSEAFFLNGVIHAQFGPGGEKPAEIKTAADVVAWYDRELPPLIEKAKGLSGDALNKVVDFFGVWQAPAFMFLQLMLKHSSHHRGQLSSYLRPMGAKVPGIYGPSGDA